MKNISVHIAGALCLLLVAGCLQGFEDHSRFAPKPPIMSKAMAGNLDALKKYVESGGAINVTDKMGNTLLMKAVVNDHLEVVEYLLSKGADPNCTNRIGETALDIAKQGAPKRVTRVLEQVTRKPRAAR